MAKAMVKCLYCGQQFDRNDPANNAIKIGRRYAHKQCSDERNAQMSQEERDQEALYNYCKELFKEDYNYLKIKKQIESYIKNYQYTYSGMLKALKWFFEVKKENIEKANGGIGIVPYIYQDAYKYYYSLYLAQQRNEQKHNDYNVKTKVIVIESPRMWIAPPKLFNLGDDENE